MSPPELVAAEEKFVLPPAPKGKAWYCAVDTSRPEPHDIYPAGGERPLNEGAFIAAKRSMAILIAR